MNTLNNLYANSVLNNLSRERRPLRMPITPGVRDRRQHGSGLHAG